MNILAIGGANLDILGIGEGEIVPGDSNPGRVTFRAGGVARNIASQLARLGCRVSLITALGRDHASETLRSVCASEGIDTRLCVEAPAGIYLCLHAPGGEMLTALNDMRGMDALTPERVLPRLEGAEADLAVMDCNLPEETLDAAARALKGKMPLFLDPVSAFKADRCRRVLPLLDAVKPNLAEARHLTGCLSPADCARALLDMGAKRAFVSLGAEGVYYAAAGEAGLCPAVPLRAGTPLTGAGDALCAGLAVGIVRGLDAAGCALEGVKAAAERLERGIF